MIYPYVTHSFVQGLYLGNGVMLPVSKDVAWTSFPLEVTYFLIDTSHYLLLEMLTFSVLSFILSCSWPNPQFTTGSLNSTASDPSARFMFVCRKAYFLATSCTYLNRLSLFHTATVSMLTVPWRLHTAAFIVYGYIPTWPLLLSQFSTTRPES